MEIMEKIKMVFSKPSNLFSKIEKENSNDTIKYFVVIALIGAVLSGLFSLLAGPFSLFVIGSAFAMTLVGLVVATVVVHIGVYIFGGRQGIEKTFKAIAYGMTPSVLLAWLPFINLIAWIYSLYLEIIGIAKLQKMSNMRAFLSIILVYLVIGLLLFLAIGTAVLLFLGLTETQGLVL